MSQATFSVRMDQNLKEKFADVCERIGMNMSTAINIFANAVVNKQKIPFELEVPSNDHLNFFNTFNTMRKKAQSSNMSDLSLDEINSIIEEVRSRRNKN